MLSVFNKKEKEMEKVKYPYRVSIYTLDDVDRELKDHKVYVSLLPDVFDFGIPVKYSQIRQILKEIDRRSNVELRAYVLRDKVAYIELHYIKIEDTYVLDC